MKNVFELYKNFYIWAGKKELFEMLPGGMLEYSDVFPIIYCKIRLEGSKTFDDVRHLLVDEMQDYTPVQYAVMSRLFKCKKTILGDVGQTMNPYSASSASMIEQVFPQGDIVKLFRSYRSTWEIAHFSLSISPNPELVAMERHGRQPELKGFNNNDEEVEEVKNLIMTFKASGYALLGIICKTQDQANFLFNEVKSPGIHLLTADSTAFKEGVIITTAYLAKGLEFDEVIVPFASARNYKTDIDRRMLYIACTRAMHQLTLTYSKERSALFDNVSSN
jgi:DNA helicase-2/ATP-dependent DNA helicase PcrA